MSTRFFSIERPWADRGCWVQLRRYVGSLWPQGSQCEAPVREGFLTCRHHAKYEATAQRVLRLSNQPKGNE